MTNQLGNSLEQAIHHEEKGHRDQAIKSLNDFIKHMNKRAHRDKISAQAKEKLKADIEDLLKGWK